jgi:hypothetical protein
MTSLRERILLRVAGVLAILLVSCPAQTLNLDREDELIHIVVGLKDGANDSILDTTTLTTMSATSSAAKTTKYGGVVTTRLKRTNAVAMTIRKSQLDALVLDPDVLFVEVDNLVFPMATTNETAGWGLAAVDAANITMPAAAANQTVDGNCFKICMVDGGMLLAHPDLVSV